MPSSSAQIPCAAHRSRVGRFNRVEQQRIRVYTIPPLRGRGKGLATGDQEKDNGEGSAEASDGAAAKKTKGSYRRRSSNQGSKKVKASNGATGRQQTLLQAWGKVDARNDSPAVN